MMMLPMLKNNEDYHYFSSLTQPQLPLSFIYFQPSDMITEIAPTSTTIFNSDYLLLFTICYCKYHHLDPRYMLYNDNDKNYSPTTPTITTNNTTINSLPLKMTKDQLQSLLLSLLFYYYSDIPYSCAYLLNYTPALVPFTPHLNKNSYVGSNYGDNNYLAMI